MAIVEDNRINYTYDAPVDHNDTSIINKNIFQIYEFYGSPEPLVLLKNKFNRLRSIIKQSDYEININLINALEKAFLHFYSLLLDVEKYICIPTISPLDDNSIDFRWKTDDYDILLNIDEDYIFSMDTDIFPSYSESVVMPLKDIFDRLFVNFRNIDTSMDKTVTRLIDF